MYGSSRMKMCSSFVRILKAIGFVAILLFLIGISRSYLLLNYAQLRRLYGGTDTFVYSAAQAAFQSNKHIRWQTGSAFCRKKLYKEAIAVILPLLETKEINLDAAKCLLISYVALGETQQAVVTIEQLKAAPLKLEFAIVENKVAQPMLHSIFDYDTNLVMTSHQPLIVQGVITSTTDNYLQWKWILIREQQPAYFDIQGQVINAPSKSCIKPRVLFWGNDGYIDEVGSLIPVEDEFHILFPFKYPKQSVFFVPRVTFDQACFKGETQIIIRQFTIWQTW